MKLDAISITSKNIPEAVKFYSLIGFTFPSFEPDTKHIEPITKSGEVRLMIDDAGLMKEILGVEPVPPNHSSFAMLCDTPQMVDEVVNKVKVNGYEIVKEPWDAFWGQRYAIIKDADGYMVDLFASNS